MGIAVLSGLRKVHYRRRAAVARDLLCQVLADPSMKIAAVGPLDDAQASTTAGTRGQIGAIVRASVVAGFVAWLDSAKKLARASAISARKNLKNPF